MKRLSTFLLIAALTLLFSLQSSFAQTATSQASTSNETKGSETKSSLEIRKETFELVWSTIKEKHFDPTFGGVDWDKVHEQYSPLVASSKSDPELHELLQRMLEELHQSHFNIIPPEAIVEEERESSNGGIGIDIQILDGLAVITKVEPNSIADRSGLRAGFVIKSIGDTSIDKFLEQLSARLEKRKISSTIKQLLTCRLVMYRINGSPQTSIKLSYLNEKDQLKEISIEREKLKGEMSERLGNFPPQYTEFEAKRIENNIGYIRFNIFVPMLSERIRSAIRSMSDASGIIIDLRGNPGGIGSMASGIASLLENKACSLGTMQMRTGHLNFPVFPQENPYLGPVVVLLDGRSASTSEVFAGGMQELGRIVVVGEKSAGAALPSVIQKLPTGALFQYAMVDFKTPKGVLIEGRGVVPDVEVKLDRKTLLSGRDPQMDAAIDQIKKNQKTNTEKSGTN